MFHVHSTCTTETTFLDSITLRTRVLKPLIMQRFHFSVSFSFSGPNIILKFRSPTLNLFPFSHLKTKFHTHIKQDWNGAVGMEYAVRSLHLRPFHLQILNAASCSE